MSTYTSRAVTHTRYEWIVPAERPWGAAQTEVAKAHSAAHRKFEQIKGRKAEYDDDICFRPTDEAIVISFTHEEPGGSE